MAHSIFALRAQEIREARDGLAKSTQEIASIYSFIEPIDAAWMVSLSTCGSAERMRAASTKLCFKGPVTRRLLRHLLGAFVTLYLWLQK